MRTAHRLSLVLTRRPVARSGPLAAPLATEVALEAVLDGDDCPAVAAALAAAGRLLAGADLTGWFDEPLLPDLARWLAARLVPPASAAGRRLRRVAAASADLRCEFHPPQ